MNFARANQELDRGTGALALADGSVFFGRGLGATGSAAAELCFNTAMTGHQEILSDLSYRGQIVCFTFPHVGNVGANDDDLQTSPHGVDFAASGAVFRAEVTPPSNWRASEGFADWLSRRGVIAISGVDTRALTRRIREHGMPNAVIAHAPDGAIDADALVEQARAWAGIEGADLAKDATAPADYASAEAPWAWPAGVETLKAPKHHVVIVDFGLKRDIARCLAGVGARATVVNARAGADAILALNPDGVVLSNGPGDPAATAQWAGDMVRALAKSGTPLLGICLGHQLLAIALGGATRKMPQGHHGANHPVLDIETGRVEIVSMNHGFTVDADSLPPGASETYRSLFDGSNSGFAIAGAPILSVQHHPEASPGPRDAASIFTRFAALMDAHKRG